MKADYIAERLKFIVAFVECPEKNSRFLQKQVLEAVECIAKETGTETAVNEFMAKRIETLERRCKRGRGDGAY